MPILSAPTTAAVLSWLFAIDWDQDGDFTGTGEDITERVLAKGQFTAAYGRDQARSLAPAAPGRATLVLNNASGDFSPDLTSSPLYGLVAPGRALLAQPTYNGVAYTLYRGKLDGFEPRRERNDKHVDLTAIDALNDLSGVKIYTALHQGILTGRAVHYILDGAGWPQDKRDIDTGATAIAWWWEDDADALEALKRVLASEGPGALMHADPDGNFVFRDRHHRFLSAASITSQATWADGPANGPEPWIERPLSYDVGWSGIFNSVSFQVEVRAADEQSVVWSLEDHTYTLVDGETIVVRARASNPFLSAVTPVSGTDYVLLFGSVAVSLSRTSGQSADIIIKATGGPAALRALQLRGRQVPVAATFTVEVADQGSIDEFGVRSYPDAAPWAGRGDAEAIARMILARRAVRAPVVSARFAGNHPARLYQQLGRDLSDRVHIIEDHHGVDHDYFIEQIQHAVQGGGFLATTFGCERAPAQITDVFVLGSATQGVLGTNRLGSRGVDDPDSIFVLGSSTHGVLGTNILAT